MTTSAPVQLASVRLITDDIPRLVRFYEVLTGQTPQYLTEDFVELVTPSATVAVSGSARVAFITTNTPRGGGANNSAIIEFLVDDTNAVYERLAAHFGDDLDVVQPPTMMPWGNLSALVRDPDGSLVNLYTPVTPEAWQLQRNRTPAPPHADL
ncbi:VOC family protein [Streptomyces griseoaurantiacus]|uniref:VOC family protein n=1 Tax=Streptomyces griseoaurantiacus TaxID=68213 RepID=UPI00345FE3B9